MDITIEKALCTLSISRYTLTGYSNSTTPTKLKVVIMVSTYNDEPVTVYDVVYLSGLSNASDPDGKGALSTFPSFYVEEGTEERGWMTWSGNSK